MIRTPRTILCGAALAVTLVACGSAGSSGAAVVGGGNGQSGSGVLPAGCANPDGSSPKTQHFTSGPPDCLEAGKSYTAVIVTNHGTLHVKLRNDIAPNTVNSFVNLARFHYFDATTCHRAIKNFVVQCGDPTATGSGGPGYEFDDELAKIEPYKIGSVAMANSGPNTNGSQFFIITGSDGAALPPQYTLFGQIESSDTDVIATLDALGNAQDGPPTQPIDITSVTIEMS